MLLLLSRCKTQFMKKLLSLKSILVLVSFLILASCKTPKSNLYLGVEVSQIETQLNNLLQNFYPRIIDTINGGYWTNFENNWTRSEEQNKMLVTQARGLWTAARASELYPENKVYRKAADHGYYFLTRHLWDTLNGGFYQNYYPDSAEKTDPAYKLTYGNAFALYSLAQYARINKDPEVLAWVKKSFFWLEETMHDPIDKGYFNVFFLSENTKVAKENLSGWENPEIKDQNTSIHLMEAFTAVYGVLPEEIIKTRLTEMLVLVRDSMTNEKGYLNLFFDSKWQPMSNRDSSREYIIQNPALDHISFGHNIETAYLLIDASRALYGSPDSVTLNVSKRLIDHTIDYGFDTEYYGLFDKGYEFNKSTPEIIDSSKVWWAQAEAWHALALFSDLYPEETRYQEAFGKMWNYITREVVDPNNGGWYNSGLDSNPRTVNDRKTHQWKSCYHDGRALMQVMIYAGN